MNPNINNKVAIIGVPLDLGAGTRGVNMGPDAIRYAGVLKRLEKIGYKVEDKGDIIVNKQSEKNAEGTHLKYLSEVSRVNSELCKTVSDIMNEGKFPLVLGGDHSVAIGTIAGVLQKVQNLGVIWFDAHADINTADTSPSGNIHGMPVAVSLGLGHENLISIGGKKAKLDPKNIAYVALRDIDPGERVRIKELGIQAFTMHEVDEMGIKTVMEEAIKIASNGTDGIHISFDMDSMDPLYAPGTGTTVPGGLTYRETNLAMEMIAKNANVVSAEFVEVNTVLDKENITAKTAVTLIGSLMGEWLI
ncbi:MAG: arginase [Filifactoraceae bacterium]